MSWGPQPRLCRLYPDRTYKLFAVLLTVGLYSSRALHGLTTYGSCFEQPPMTGLVNLHGLMFSAWLAIFVVRQAFSLFHRCPSH